MKQLNWYQIFGQTHTIPDGSTVTPTDDVQILLNCANIWDKAYTTIADLLSDTTSLLAVIVDNNAINYLVRSTTFASSVTADATAMTDIGGDNYASNTLLADSTWCTAICNSTYFESVLNVKIPTMTSNTTPSGEAFADSVKGAYYAYKAFDKSTSSPWVSTETSMPHYVGYQFTTKVSVYKVVATYIDSAQSYVKAFSIQASDDSFVNDIQTIYSGTEPDYGMTQVTRTYITSPGTTRKQAVRFYVTSNYKPASDPKAGVDELQFYGRADV